MDTIWVLETSKEAVIGINFKSDISEGKFKVVLIFGY
jgi:hypothetical protein